MWKTFLLLEKKARDLFVKSFKYLETKAVWQF